MATLDVSQPTLVPGTHSTKNITMPADVCGYIIAFLDDSEDPRTILACTLVSRSLLPIARFKLFRSISFKHERSWSLFKVFLSPAAPSHIAPYLKTVEELHIYPHSRDPWFSEILVECSEYLTGVKRISLRSIEWTPAWRSSLSSITPYVSLEVLQINPGVFDDVEQLYLLLSAFPTLPHLILDCADPWFKTNSGHDLHKWPGFQPLTTLEFRRYKMVRWLGKLGYLGHLKSLTWCGEFRAVQCKWRALSEAIDGSSLLSLCCDVQNRVYCTCFLTTISAFECYRDSNGNVLHSQYVAVYMPHHPQAEISRPLRKFVERIGVAQTDVRLLVLALPRKTALLFLLRTVLDSYNIHFAGQSSCSGQHLLSASIFPSVRRHI